QPVEVVGVPGRDLVVDRQPVHAGLDVGIVLPLPVEHVVVDDERADAAGGHGVVRRLVGLGDLVLVVPALDLAADAGAGGDGRLLVVLLGVLELALAPPFDGEDDDAFGERDAGVEAGAEAERGVLGVRVVARVGALFHLLYGDVLDDLRLAVL